MMDPGARPGDDDVDPGIGDQPARSGDRHEDGPVRVDLEGERVAFRAALQHAHDDKQRFVDFDERADDPVRPVAAHRVGQVGADNAVVAVDIEVGDEPAGLERQTVDGRERRGDALDAAAPELLSGMPERPVPLHPRRRLGDRRDGRGERHGVGRADRAWGLERLAHQHDVGAERLELLAGLFAGDLAERDHGDHRGDADRDADEAQHRAQPRLAQAVGRLAGIGAEDGEGARHRGRPTREAGAAGRRSDPRPHLRRAGPRGCAAGARTGARSRRRG